VSKMEENRKPQKRITVFSTPVCPYCITLKAFLKDKGFDFEDVDISQNEKKKEEIIEKTGKMQAPIIEIDDQIVVGFDKEKICQLLNIKE